MSIKRFESQKFIGGMFVIAEKSDGKFVLHSDYAALEAKCAALVAENAALKSGVTYFAYSPEYGFDYFKDKQSAIDTAQDEIDAYREDADDGWSEDVQRVSWGIVVQQAQGFDAQGLHTSDSQHTYQTCDYRLVSAPETPATDAFLAEVRASGVEAAIATAKNVVAQEFQCKDFETAQRVCSKFPQSDMVGKVEMVEWLEDFAAQLRQGGAV